MAKGGSSCFRPGGAPARERGAALVELAFVLPVLLLIVLGCILMLYAKLAVSSLESAMSDAAILATTRGDRELLNFDVMNSDGSIGIGIVEQIDEWYMSNRPVSDLIVVPDFARLFLKNTDPAAFTNTMNAFVLNSSIFNTSDPRLFPAFYYYALVYVYQAMERNLGGVIKYPCPRPLTESSCLNCGFYSTLPGADESTPQNISLNQDPILGTKDLHMRCRYKVLDFPLGLPDIEFERVVQILGKEGL